MADSVQQESAAVHAHKLPALLTLRIVHRTAESGAFCTSPFSSSMLHGREAAQKNLNEPDPTTTHRPDRYAASR